MLKVYRGPYVALFADVLPVLFQACSGFVRLGGINSDVNNVQINWASLDLHVYHAYVGRERVGYVEEY